MLVCGHTYKPYHRVLPSGRHVVIAGSVGKPKDGGPRAGYVVPKADGDRLQVDFIRAVDGIKQAAQAIEASDMPDEFARLFRSGKG